MFRHASEGCDKRPRANAASLCDPRVPVTWPRPSGLAPDPSACTWHHPIRPGSPRARRELITVIIPPSNFATTTRWRHEVEHPGAREPRRAGPRLIRHLSGLRCVPQITLDAQRHGRRADAACTGMWVPRWLEPRETGVIDQPSASSRVGRRLQVRARPKSSPRLYHGWVVASPSLPAQSGGCVPRGPSLLRAHPPSSPSGRASSWREVLMGRCYDCAA